ncbi:MAG: DbpA RNA binding domain-containing protein, partial [Actinomycetota bacterium]|nr:DbpA RNA binding domain-containing protein [Actinomycetota bacterium]
PARIQMGRESAGEGEAPLVRQSAYIVARAHKPAALGRVLDIEAPAAALVFCRTRAEVDQLAEQLNGRGYRAEALHGGMDQAQRDRVMGRLRSGTADLIVATDVAARGLDIDQLTHVINYDVPSDPDSYIHRIGRVGRAGREGVAVTLAEPREHRMLKAIERMTKQPIAIEKVPTVADLRARQLEMTRSALHESILEDDLDGYRVVVETLADEFDVVQVALAAVKLAHEASGAAADEEHIPEVAARPAKDSRGRAQAGGRGEGPGDGFGSGGSRSGPESGGRPGAAARGGRRSGASDPGMARLFVGAGRIAKIRPKDLVGAIANESRLSGRDIGAIEIADRFSLVEVPEESADEVIAALRASTIKGKSVQVRRDRGGR